LGIETKWLSCCLAFPQSKRLSSVRDFKPPHAGSEHNDAFYYDGQTVKTKPTATAAFWGHFNRYADHPAHSLQPTPSIGIPSRR
jgi:hypothetical protein